MFVRACAAYARAHPEQAVGSAEAWEEAALLEQWRQRWYEARNEQAATQQSPTSVGADPEPGYATTAFATGTLPAEVTSFVGRKTDLAAVEERLAHGGTVTLVGTGGVGKTRLALHVARRVCDRYRDGVGLVELASVTDPQAVVWTVGAALRIPDGSADASADTLAAALADRELLLLLDNCEHLVESCAVLVETLRRRAPGVQILATSRRPLGCAGEQLWQVHPLSVPGSATPLEHLTRYESVELLVDRAAAVVPGFTVDEDNHRAVIRLCQLLEGVPLLVELAARGLRVLSPRQLLERLEEGLSLPDSSVRTAPDRHRTLRAVLDWSYGLCTPDERRAWARLSIFGGDFTLEGAEAVLAEAGWETDKALHAVTGLVDQSVLTAYDAEGQRYYRMLEPVRRYGRDRLAESGTAEETRRRLRDWYLTLVERAESAWSGAGQALWFRRLRRGHADLKVALRAGLDDPATVRRTLRAMGTLWPYWMLCVPLSESRHWLELGLQRCQEPGPERDKALWVCGFVAVLQRDLDTVDRCAREIEQEGTGGTRTESDAALLRSLAALSWAEAGTARAKALRALQGYRRHGDEFGEQVTLGLLTLIGEGDQATVAEYHRKAVELSLRRGERWHRSYLLSTFGIYLWRQGEADEAAAHLVRSLEISAEFDDRLGGCRARGPPAGSGPDFAGRGRSPTVRVSPTAVGAPALRGAAPCRVGCGRGGSGTRGGGTAGACGDRASPPRVRSSGLRGWIRCEDGGRGRRAGWGRRPGLRTVSTRGRVAAHRATPVGRRCPAGGGDGFPWDGPRRTAALGKGELSPVFRGKTGFSAGKPGRVRFAPLDCSTGNKVVINCSECCPENSVNAS